MPTQETAEPDRSAPSDSNYQSYVLAHRAALIRNLTPGLSHSLANALQAFALANPSRDVRERASARLESATRMLAWMSGPESTRPAPVLLPRVVTAVEEYLGYQKSLAEPALNCRIDGVIPAVAVRELHLFEGLLAAVTNAKEAIQGVEGAEVTLRAAASPSAITITIEDQGPGFPPGPSDRLFEPFFTTKDRERHLGLGLTVARYLVGLDGGRIRVEPSGKQPGASLVFELPIWRSQGS